MHLISAALALALFGGDGSAYAGGGYSETSGGTSVYNSGIGQAEASSTGTTTFSSPDVDYTSSISATAITNVQPGFNEAAVQTGGTTNLTFSTNETTTAEQQTTSKVTSFSKNGGVIVKGRSNSLTTVVIGGRTYLVADEVARAAARSTPYGSSAATDTDVTITTSADPNTYSVGTVTTNKANRTPQ